MGYDVEPLVTLETKRAMLTKAAREGWLVIFEHDATVASGQGVKLLDGKGFALDRLRADSGDSRVPIATP